MPTPFANPRSILVTGASSGIGEALALGYAKRGVVLALTGRNRVRLDAVANSCRSRGADVIAEAIDVTNRKAMARWVVDLDARHPLDLVIANAGISAGTAGGLEDEDQVRSIFDVNLGGVLNAVLPVLGPMRARRRGQIAVVSSLAAYRGQPGAPAYSASKAAAKAWAEGLRPLVAADGVGVSVVCPGFVESRITAANTFPMPFLMPAERAARIIIGGLARNKPRISFPWPMAFGAWMMGTLPPRVIDPLLARGPRKK